VARDGGLKALLAEPGGHGGDLQTVADDLGLRLLPFDPLETLPAGSTAGPDHYLDTMRRNGQALVSALGG
jgi:zinc/manganese transport system substrate-binding protein